MQDSFDQYFGGSGWRDIFESFQRSHEREEAIRLTYLSRLRTLCSYQYVATTRVRFEDKHRTYFYLAYGTRHHTGMEVFRRVEKKTVTAQEGLAYGSHIERTSLGGSNPDLFMGMEDPNLGVFRGWVEAARGAAKREFEQWLASGIRRKQSDAAALFMQHPYVELKTVEGWFAAAEKAGQLKREGAGSGAWLIPSTPTKVA